LLVKIAKSSVKQTGDTGRQSRLTETNVRGEDGPRTTCCSYKQQTSVTQRSSTCMRV